MTVINAAGTSIRHAVARALATVNQAPVEATFRVTSARVELDGHARVRRAEAQIEVLKPAPIGARSPEQLLGLVNPDGAHPLMVRIGAERPFFLDIVPVTWERWMLRVEDSLPPGLDPHCPRVGVKQSEAAHFAARLGKRLPTVAELRQAWGPSTYPWGPDRDPSRGRSRAPRYDELPEVALHPAPPTGVYDLGAWLWQWTAEGSLFGGSEDGQPGFDQPPASHRLPVGFRLAQTA